MQELLTERRRSQTENREEWRGRRGRRGGGGAEERRRRGQRWRELDRCACCMQRWVCVCASLSISGCARVRVARLSLTKSTRSTISPIKGRFLFFWFVANRFVPTFHCYWCHFVMQNTLNEHVFHYLNTPSDFLPTGFISRKERFDWRLGGSFVGVTS